jgi:hypothetical protein
MNLLDLHAEGCFGGAVDVSPEPGEPRDADDFARRAIFVICQASVTPQVARQTYERCLRALATGSTARLGFRHPAKAEAIDLIWRERHGLYRAWIAAPDRRAHLVTLPWIGPVMRRRLGTLLGLGDEASGRPRRAA